MNKIIIFTLFVVVLFLSGCSDESQVKQITISSMNTIQDISSVEPISITVSGMKSIITVQRGTPVESVVISGMDSVVRLPKGSNPRTTISGMNAKI